MKTQLQKQTIPYDQASAQEKVKDQSTALARLNIAEPTQARISALKQRQARDYSCVSINHAKWPLYGGVNRTSLLSGVMATQDRFLSKAKPSPMSLLKQQEVLKLSMAGALNITCKNRGEGDVKYDFIDLARHAGFSFNMGKLNAIEHIMLDTLDWKINAPTPEEFIHEFFELFASDKKLDPALCQKVLNFSESLARKAVRNDAFICEKTQAQPGQSPTKRIVFEASDIGLAALCVSIYSQMSEDLGLAFDDLIQAQCETNVDKVHQLGLTLLRASR